MEGKSKKYKEKLVEGGWYREGNPLYGLVGKWKIKNIQKKHYMCMWENGRYRKRFILMGGQVGKLILFLKILLI